MILFRQSFIYKPLHIFRTIPPYLTEQLVIDIDNMKKRILCSIIGCVDNELSDLDFQLSKLPIDQGGLGLQNSSILAQSAFVASLIDYHNQNNQCLDISSNGHQIQQFLHTSQIFLDNALTIQHLMSYTRSNSSSVQHQLTKKLVDLEFIRLKQLLKNHSTHQLVWFNNLQNSEAGKWLEVLPLYSDNIMPSKEYRTALRHRLFLKMENFIPGSKCTCSNHCLLDPLGHHLSTGCSTDGYRNELHDIVKVEFCSVLNYAGYHVKKEERNLFRAVDPTNGDRPDISIINYNGTALKLLLDVTIPAVLHYSKGVLVGVNANNVGKSAETASRSKNKQYNQVSIASGHSFLPIVFESNGYVHPDTVKFIKSIAAKCAPIKKIPKDVLYAYFMKRLSVRLQMGIAKSIIQRSYLLSKNTLPDHTFADNAVFNHTLATN
jgi:hypothetical protein